MPLGKNATAGDYVKDFRKSKAPQFKGKSKEKRHKMAIAAYLDKRDSQKEAKLAGNNLKLFSQINRNRTKPELDRTKKPVKKAVQKEGSYKVSIAGLPDMYMDDKTPGQLLQKLRKIVKQPSMITDVERTTKAKKRKGQKEKKD